MKKVIIESPLSAPTRDAIEANKVYARRCIVDSLRRGEAPFASHLLYDQQGILDDLLPDQRETGILAGFAWGEAADMVVFYIDFGISAGMYRGFERAILSNADIVVRSLKTDEELYVPIEIELAGTMLAEEAHKRNLHNLRQSAIAVCGDTETAERLGQHQIRPE